jgi:hypothetical protein
VLQGKATFEIAPGLGSCDTLPRADRETLPRDKSNGTLPEGIRPFTTKTPCCRRERGTVAKVKGIMKKIKSIRKLRKYQSRKQEKFSYTNSVSSVYNLKIYVSRIAE